MPELLPRNKLFGGALLAIALLERVLNEVARLRQLFQIRRPRRTSVQVLRNPNPRSSTRDRLAVFCLD